MFWMAAVLLAMASGAYAQHPLLSDKSATPQDTPLPQETMQLPISKDTMMEEGKALFENGQYVAALGKFMGVLRRDPHNPDARQYLRLVIDAIRENPAHNAGAKNLETQAAIPSTQVDQELRQMLQKRSAFTLDLQAIPGVRLQLKNNAAVVDIDTLLLFADQSGGLKEQAVPILDRVSAWLKTFGQQPIIIHCYPEELQDPEVNGSLFLHRYSELYNFFVEERKMAPQRFISADLLVQDKKTAADTAPAVSVSTSGAHVIIETLGTQSALLEAMPAAVPRHALARWLEMSILSSKSVFNPEEGEWASLDLAALTRTGIRAWNLTIFPSGTAKPVFRVDGKSNLLKRVSWDGHDQSSGDFVPPGPYVCRLSATNSDGTIKTSEITIHVERTTQEAPVAATPLVEKKHPKPGHHAKKRSKKVEEEPAQAEPAPEPAAEKASAAAAPAPASNSDSETLVGNGSESPSSSAGSDSGDSVQAIWKQVIQFEFNQRDLKPTLKASLERIGKTLEVYPLQKVRVMGFAMTSERDAQELARQRADKVRAILVDEYHVDKKRVINAGGKIVTGDGGSKVELSITN